MTTSVDEISISTQRPRTSHVPKFIPQPSYVHETQSEVKQSRPKTSHGSKFVRPDQESLGTFPEYAKSYRSRVSFENYPETSSDRRSSLKTEPPRPRTRRPQTPRFATDLEKIPEEPESIGDSEDSFTKFNSEISNLKILLQEGIKGLKDNCEESQKTLQEKVEMLEMKLKQEYQKELEVRTKDKSREIANLMKKNEALNTSLKHKADEILKLKREIIELKERTSEASSIRT